MSSGSCGEHMQSRLQDHWLSTPCVPGRMQMCMELLQQWYGVRRPQSLRFNPEVCVAGPAVLPALPT